MSREIIERIEKINELQEEILKILDESEEAIYYKKYKPLDIEVLKDLRVAAIFDPFTEECFKPECQLTQLTPMYWEQEIDVAEPHVLIVESAWQGFCNLWENKLTPPSHELLNICDYCKSNNIPIVFWNKEDPVSFDTFFQLAKLADFVFTTDINCIRRYRETLRHNRVYLLPFAAQPKIHNPIEIIKRKRSTEFAGAYYSDKKKRCEDFAALFDVCNELTGVDIFDRNNGIHTPGKEYPKKYLPFIRGTSSPAKIYEVYKSYLLGLNINTVQNSATMFARRVFELLASNTVVVSNYSRGIKAFFGDLVIASDNPSEIRNSIKRILDDNELSDKIRLLGLRKVLKEHLYSDRLNLIVGKVFGRTVQEALPHVCVLSDAKETHDVERIKALFEKQTYSEKELIFFEENSERTIGDLCKEGYVALFCKNDWYGENYLLDMVLATRIDNYDVIGKNEYYSNKGNKITIVGCGTSYQLNNCIYLRRGIVKKSLINDNSLKDILEKEIIGNNGISIDRFNYCSDNDALSFEKCADLSIDQGLNLASIIEQAQEVEYEQLLHWQEKIPCSNGSRYYKKNDIRIGIVTDEIEYLAIQDTADFRELSPNNWMSVEQETDMFLFVSCWKGLHNDWRGISSSESENRKLLYRIIEHYKTSGKPTVFYSIEDPPNYDKYIEVAKRCDYIFTTCNEIKDKYSKDCNNSVYVLPFGINPTVHNPIGLKKEEKKKMAFMAGSWMEKYPKRCTDARMLFDGVLESTVPLVIADRNYDLTDKQYAYPEKYKQYIIPGIDHRVLQNVHKLFDYGLNLNSVTDSFTMYANRCPELLALGAIEISNYSVGVNDRLPLVHTVVDSKEVSLILNNSDEENRYAYQINGVRSVMTGETTFERMAFLLSTVLKKDMSKEPEHKVLVIVEEITSKILKMYEEQTYSCKNIVVKNELTDTIYMDSDIVTFWDETMFYDVFYLEDMINAFKYTDSKYITKASYYKGNKLNGGIEHDYVNSFESKYRTVFWREEFQLDYLLNVVGDKYDGGYSIDHFNYNSESFQIRKRDNYKLSVIIPVYNNGLRLMGKAFASLQRSSIFINMEVIIVDDGSTDDYTEKIVHWYDHNFENVKIFCFGDGGSGSASRPRNKGIELSTAEYVTYLDPDNEAINDGYARLFSICVEGGYDIVVGDIRRVSTTALKPYYYSRVVAQYGSDEIIDDSKKLLTSTKFMPCSNQAMVIKKKIIVDNKLHQPEGAISQDTLFYWDLVTKSSRIKFIDLPIHIYYAAVSNSTVNSVSAKYFLKYKKICIPQREMFITANIIEASGIKVGTMPNL